jgi:hypothetical protein
MRGWVLPVADNVRRIPGGQRSGYREHGMVRLSVPAPGDRMATVTRARRTAIQRAAQRIRMRCQREHHTVEQTVTEIRAALPEVTALEAWRLALGWSRAETIEQVAALYVAAGLRPRGLTDAMLCRWEHDAGRWPDDEYAVMLCRPTEPVPSNSVWTATGGRPSRACSGTVGITPPPTTGSARTNRSRCG